MKYLKQFKQASEYEVFKESEDYVLPNVSYVVETKGVSYAPKKVFKLRAKYNATPDNLVAFTGASNLKSLKVNGTPIKFEPIKNEIATFDVLGENISLDMETGAASFPESYLIKSPVTSWSFKAKDPNYTINENTFVCMLGMMDGMTTASPAPLNEVMGSAFTTNDGVTLEAVDTFLAGMSMQGIPMCFTLCDMDMNSGMFMFIDTEHQTKVTTGGLPTYSFDSEGLYDVEIELADPIIKMQFDETSLISIEIGNSITTISDGAFSNCLSLTSVTIPNGVTSIGDGAFYNCKKLTGELVIPNSVTTIGEWAFDACSGLTSVTIGSGVTTIEESAFGYCSSLTSIACLASTAPTITDTTFQGVKRYGSLYYPEGSDYSSWLSADSYYLGYYNWNINITSDYLTIEALKDGLTASFTNACEYCVDGDGNWKTLTAGTATESINIGHTLSFRGNLTPTSSKGIGTFTISKTCNLKGNCMSMLFGDNAANNYSLSGKNYAFYSLFKNCTNIVNISENFLPATTLANYCYSSMFYGCTNLTTAPELPATTLASRCYYSMFNDCTKLTTAPELPATTLAQSCYYSMFNDCTKLTTAPELPATTLAEYCYSNMFSGCTSLATAPALPATILASNCYSSMFKACIGLTTAPELPATTLAEYCYSNMFQDCPKLTTAPELPATTLAKSCYSNMFQDCPKLTTAPELPATTLADWCYSSMFSSCKKLNYIKMLATDISASSCLKNWVTNVASSGIFVKNPAMTSLPTGTAGIPSGWTVEDAA